MKKFFKTLGIIILSLVCIYSALFVTNFFLNVNLRNYIDSFDPVVYESQLQPTIDKETGYVQFKSDKDIKITNLTDIHLGGGFLSHRTDKKVIREVITILQNEKPDLVVLDGDNVFAIPYISGTFNNKLVSKTIMHIFEHERVYYSTVFGNHDTEVFDYTKRAKLGSVYAKAPYCVFQQDFDGYGVTNQIIELKNVDDIITKAIVLLDSNAYVDESISAVIKWEYDTIHDEQVTWVKESVTEKLAKHNRDTIASLATSGVAGLAKATAYELSGNNKVGILLFCHIPTSEFAIGLADLQANNFTKTSNAKYVSGVWDEEEAEALRGGRVWFGGCQDDKYSHTGDEDKVYEVLYKETGLLEGFFVGHDHVNNGVIVYGLNEGNKKGVLLSYGYSLDNLAYSHIDEYSYQRGSTRIIIDNSGDWEQTHVNLYKELQNGNYTSEYEYELGNFNQYYDNYIPAN